MSGNLMAVGEKSGNCQEKDVVREKWKCLCGNNVRSRVVPMKAKGPGNYGTPCVTAIVIMNRCYVIGFHCICKHCRSF